MNIDLARAAFAEELRFVAHIRSQPLLAAFATVPRENFLGERPWQVADLARGYGEVPGDHPADACHNVLFALDSARQRNNGHSEFWARLLGRPHRPRHRHRDRPVPGRRSNSSPPMAPHMTPASSM